MKKITLIIFIALCLSACTQNGTDKFNVEITDFSFTPNQYTIKAGEQVTLKVAHEGLVAHDFIVMKLNTNVGAHFDKEDLPNVYWQITIQPGETQMVTFTAPNEPGVYQVVCGMAGHIEAGMIGELVVVNR